MCCSMAASLPSNTRCRLELGHGFGPDGEHRVLHLEARSVYAVFSASHGVKVGFHFLDPSEQDLATIDRLVGVPMRVR